jgi:hypothetical protein
VDYLLFLAAGFMEEGLPLSLLTVRNIVLYPRFFARKRNI